MISSGIVGLIIYIFFTILVFIKSIKLIYFNYSNYKIILPVTLILIILIRSVVESSYAVFGIDFIVFFTSILIINDIHYKIKINMEKIFLILSFISFNSLLILNFSKIKIFHTNIDKPDNLRKNINHQHL